MQRLGLYKFIFIYSLSSHMNYEQTSCTLDRSDVIVGLNNIKVLVEDLLNVPQ